MFIFILTSRHLIVNNIFYYTSLCSPRIGIYAVDTPSAPGLADGMWLYVPVGAKGTVTFKPAFLPRTDGVYEVRYHRQVS